MPSTSNKGFTIPATGTEVDTWGNDLNANLTGILDLNLGGIVTLTLGSSNVVLDTTQSQNLIVRLIGNLTANVTVETVCKGMTIVENLTTGAFTVQFGNSVSKVTIPQNTRAVVITDTTNGARTAADNQTEFASGTALLFAQASAPPGWTKQSTNNCGIQVVNTSGGSGGGSLGFSSVFGSQPLSGTVGGTALDITQIPNHAHTVSAAGLRYGDNGGFSHDFCGSNGVIFSAETPSLNTSPVGGGQTHSHGLSMNNLNLALAFLTVIHCVKN